MFWKAGIDVPWFTRRVEKVLLPVMHRARICLRSRESGKFHEGIYGELVLEPYEKDEPEALRLEEREQPPL